MIVKCILSLNSFLILYNSPWKKMSINLGEVLALQKISSILSISDPFLLFSGMNCSSNGTLNLSSYLNCGITL